MSALLHHSKGTTVGDVTMRSEWNCDDTIDWSGCGWGVPMVPLSSDRKPPLPLGQTNVSKRRWRETLYYIF